MSVEMTKLIMNGTTDERLMTIGDLSEMLGTFTEDASGVGRPRESGEGKPHARRQHIADRLGI
jgi:hypothetical protein